MGNVLSYFESYNLSRKMLGEARGRKILFLKYIQTGGHSCSDYSPWALGIFVQMGEFCNYIWTIRTQGSVPQEETSFMEQILLNQEKIIKRQRYRKNRN